MSELVCYHQAFDYPGPLDEFCVFMRRMDSAFLDHVEKQRDIAEKSKKRKGGKS